MSITRCFSFVTIILVLIDAYGMFPPAFNKLAFV